MAGLTDREILESCARACGLYEQWAAPDYEVQTIAKGLWCSGMGEGYLWNPLEDDGDCAHMENKCGVTVDCEAGISGFPRLPLPVETFTPGNDTERRRASCIVAARAQIEREKGGA